MPSHFWANDVAEFAQALSGVLQKLRPEPEEELSRFVGDAAAVRIVALLRAALAGAREAGSRLAVQAERPRRCQYRS